METQTTSNRKGEEGWINGFALLRGIAYAAAAAAGIGAGVSKIWDMFYDNFKSSPLITGLRTERHKRRAELFAKAPQLEAGAFTKEYRGIENWYGHEFNETIKKHLGIESEGLGFFKGTFQRFDALGKYTQNKILYAVTLSVVGGVGSLVLLEKFVFGNRSHAERAKAPAENQDITR